MFVMTQAFKNVMDGPESKLPLDERIGLTMKYAGVTITVTSVTDFIAFAIGATTVRFSNCLNIRNLATLSFRGCLT